MYNLTVYSTIPGISCIPGISGITGITGMIKIYILRSNISAHDKLAVCDVTNLPCMDINWQAIPYMVVL